MKKTQYLTMIIVSAVIWVAVVVLKLTVLSESLSWFMVALIAILLLMFVRYRIEGSHQYFSGRFNMLLDYDLDVDGAIKMAKDAYDNAPTIQMKNSYQMYLGIALYYKGEYDEAIKTFNMVDLTKINNVFHGLIFAFSGYCAFELKDQELLAQYVERLHALEDRVPAKYRDFIANYAEILEAIKNMDISIDQYKEAIDKNFARDDGYLARKLNYQYRLSFYYEAIGDTLEMDKCLAFCIANGKEQHTALRAKERFQGSVDPADFVWDPAKAKDPVEPAQPQEPQVLEAEIVSEEVVEDSSEETENKDE
ncbi:MAG: hypothetical protein PHP32_01360 [Candidatus Izemoplasmatales bacterium]|nr:hypothetical protein [Candidatus Izemoplasmatales bacterium]